MKFEREQWRPLFVREPVERRTWNITTRALRAYLIQVAEEDGTLLKACADPSELATILSVHPEEVALVHGAIRALMVDDFLHWTGHPGCEGWLGINRLILAAEVAGEQGRDG